VAWIIRSWCCVWYGKTIQKASLGLYWHPDAVVGLLNNSCPFLLPCIPLLRFPSRAKICDASMFSGTRAPFKRASFSVEISAHECEQSSEVPIKRESRWEIVGKKPDNFSEHIRASTRISLTMLASPRIYSSVASVSAANRQSIKFFSTCSPLLAPKNKKDIEAKKAVEKRAERREALKKLQAKKPANSSPLFMSIAQALRYLRAAEIGRHVNEASITVQTPILKDRGVAPIQGQVRLPKPLKDTKILCITNDEAKIAEAIQNGATQAGDAKLIDEIANGTLAVEQFDKVLATPEIEQSLKKVSKILGPKGLMPSTKRGTISEDLNNLILGTLGTQPFRERNNYVSLTVGKCNFTDSEILNNILATSNALKASIAGTKSKKPIIVGQTILSSTHGPGIVVNF
jgi:large subunit ribosomal protein L1